MGVLRMNRWVSGVVLATTTLLASTTGARADDACWHLVLGAIAHEAAASHPSYIAYSENVDISSGGRPFIYYDTDIVYRIDGVAYIEDGRFARAFVSDELEPGPPVLGPYGSARNGWLPEELRGGRLQTIASVENVPHLRCNDEGDETIDGERYAHLVVGVADERRPALKEIWVDRQSLWIPRLIVSGYLLHYQSYSVERGLADYQVEMQNVAGFAVVRTVRWSSYVRWYHETAKLDGVYTFGNYHFTAADSVRRQLMRSSQSIFSSPRPRL